MMTRSLDMRSIFAPTVWLIAGLAAILAFAAPAAAQPDMSDATFSETIRLGTASSPYRGDITVSAGKALVLRFDRNLDEVLVGDPDIADIVPLTSRSVYVLGQGTGSTSLTILDSQRQMIGMLHLQVENDLLPIKMRLFQLFPGENIEVRSAGRSVILSGEASDSEVSNTAMEVASSFSSANVINMMRIRQPQQVMLAVRVAEIERTAARELGLSADVLFNAGDAPDGFFSDVSEIGRSGSIISTFTDGSVSVDLMLDALEERGVATVLAEPTLMALSGEPASFLAGGEFPVPVGTRGSDGGRYIEIEFKQFGVRLNFTPTVIGRTINLLVEPEVSELDRQNGIELDGINIPGISARRATTTVELAHGQSFAIAGLMSESFADQIEQFPGLGAIPVLGAIGRSAAFQREETELTIIITPYLVTPSDPDSLSTPLAHFVRPNTFEMFLLGRSEVPSADRVLWNTSADAGSTNASGIDGPVGYILE